MQFDFKWDPRKAEQNVLKHGVTFQMASSVFRDPRALSTYDVDHSGDEERWVTLGIGSTGALLVVHHTYTQIDEGTAEIRIMSCRKATQREQNQYAE